MESLMLSLLFVTAGLSEHIVADKYTVHYLKDQHGHVCAVPAYTYLEAERGEEWNCDWHDPSAHEKEKGK